MQRQQTYNYQHQIQSHMGQQCCTTIPSHLELQTQLLESKFHQYKSKPYQYILQIMKLQSSSYQFTTHLQKYQAFLKSVSSFYNNIPYHNITHAFDVMITCDKFLINYKMIEQINLTYQDRIFILIAAYAHDNGHQGLTNNFYINSQNQLALKYSNLSPLQNMHSSNLLTSLRMHNIQISKQHKQLMVQLILATDNKHHFSLLQKIKQYQTYINNKIIQNLNESQEGTNAVQKTNKQHKTILLQMIIHTADLGPCGKPLNDYLKWNQRLYQQFKTQYHKQRQLNIQKSFHFDINKLQQSIINQNLNFLNKMVLPFFKQVSIVMPQFWTQLNNSIAIRNYFQSKTRSIQSVKTSKKEQKQYKRQQKR